MRRLDIFKLSLTLCALVLFAWGIYSEQAVYRWAGIACLAAAVIIRFIGPRRPLN